jgi:hypothetical protein
MLIADKGAAGLLLPANRLIDPATLSPGQRSRGEKGRDGPPNRDGVRDLARNCGLEEERRPSSSAAPATRRPPDSRLEDRQSRISATAQAKFLEDATRAMDDRAFALHLAAKAYPSEGGLLFYVASAATAGPIRRLRWHRAQNKNESWACHPWRKRGASCGERSD